MLEKGIIEIINGTIFVRRTLSDLLKVPPRDDAVEVDVGRLSGG